MGAYGGQRTPLPVDREAIVRMTLDGRGRAAIAEHFGVTVAQLETWCRNHMVPVPPRDPSPRGRAPTNPEDIADRARDLRRALDDDPSGSRPPVIDPPNGRAPSDAEQGRTESSPSPLRSVIDLLRREIEQASSSLEQARSDLQALERAEAVLQRRGKAP